MRDLQLSAGDLRHLTERRSSVRDSPRETLLNGLDDGWRI